MLLLEIAIYHIKKEKEYCCLIDCFFYPVTDSWEVIEPSKDLNKLAMIMLTSTY